MEKTDYLKSSILVLFRPSETCGCRIPSGWACYSAAVTFIACTWRPLILPRPPPP